MVIMIIKKRMYKKIAKISIYFVLIEFCFKRKKYH